MNAVRASTDLPPAAAAEIAAASNGSGCVWHEKKSWACARIRTGRGDAARESFSAGRGDAARESFSARRRAMRRLANQ